MTRRIAFYSWCRSRCCLLHPHSRIIRAAPRTPAAPDRSSPSRRRHWKPAMARSRSCTSTSSSAGSAMPQLIAAAGKHIHAHSIGTIQSPIASASYGVTDDFMVSVRMPWVNRTDIREGHHAHGPGGVVTTRSTIAATRSGFGDVTVLGQWRFLNNTATRTEAAFLFGVKAPTGATDRLDAQGLLFETEFQPGSGSWDLLLGGAFTQRFGAWSFDANVLGIIAGRGAQDTNLGEPLALQRGGLLPAGRLHAARAAAALPVAARRPRWRTGRCRTATRIRSTRSRRATAMDRRRGARAQRRSGTTTRRPAQREGSQLRRPRAPALAGPAHRVRRVLGLRARSASRSSTR